jgi:hypothetical protein
MKIAVLGASLSAQTTNHKDGEVTGYVEAFRRKNSSKFQLMPKDITQFTYGGNRLSDAGFIQLEDLIISRPDICIVEPIVEDISRGREANEQDYLYVFNRLIENDILPIVFCVPLPLGAKVLESRRYLICREICHKYKIPLKTIDLSKATNDGLIFNGLHTNTSTAYYLASELDVFMREINFIEAWESLSNLNILNNIAVQPISPFKNKNVRSVSIDFQAGSFGRLSLIQRQNIGPYSPVLSITITQKNPNASIKRQEKSVWDRYCYYQRSSYVTLCDVNVEAGDVTILIDIADTQPNYSKCSKYEGSWPKANELRLEPLGAIMSISNCSISYNNITITHTSDSD